MPIVDSVLPHLDRMLNLNRSISSELRGGAICAGFEGEIDGMPWVQAKSGTLNVYYPSDREPVAALTAAGVPLPPGIICADWEPWKFATLEFSALEAPAFAALIQHIFVDFFDMPEDFRLRSEVFDMR